MKIYVIKEYKSCQSNLKKKNSLDIYILIIKSCNKLIQFIKWNNNS